MQIKKGFFGKDITMELLHKLDDKLNFDLTVIVCGTTALHVQGIDYRQTTDLDFAQSQSNIVWGLIARILQENPQYSREIYDDKACGVWCPLEDYEDRLVEIDGKFKYLKVFAISIEDWIVTQLESKKFESVLQYPVMLTRKRLQFIEDNMYKYCGTKPEYAKQSLKMLWEKVEEIESASDDFYYKVQF